MPRKTKSPVPTQGDFLLYQSEDGKVRLEVRLADETVWLSQAQISELFQTSVPNISMHIRNVFEEGELRENSVIKDSLSTAADGKNYTTRFYNLDVIISVGYRVKSLRGTQFRIWATQLLREQAMIKADLEFRKYQAVEDSQHRQVDRHFEEAVKKLPKPSPSKSGASNGP